MKIVLVGESWGKHEEKFNHALVYYSGKQLAQMMFEAGLSPKVNQPFPTETDMIEHWKLLREEYSIAVTNVFQEHPDNDRTEIYFSNDKNAAIELDLPQIKLNNRVLWLKREYRHHIDRLWSELEEWKPNVIIALGNYACWALLGQTSITAIRGTPKISLKLNLKVLPTFHPAALRQWQLRPTIIADLTKAARESAYPEIRRIERWITCEDPLTRERMTLDEIEAWLKVPADNYTIDIETGYALYTKAEIKNMSSAMRRILSELISMVSFARNNTEALVIPFMTRDDPELNYWSTKSEEIRAWGFCRSALASPIPKTFQNGIFDISHFLRNGIRIRNATDDSMIAQHAIFPERRRGLGELASIHSDEISWKQMRSGGESLKREE